MTDRITRPMVDARVQTINRMLGIKDPSWDVPGSIEVEGAYGGTRVVQVTSEHASIRILKDGYGPLRETYLYLQGMIAALEITQGA